MDSLTMVTYVVFAAVAGCTVVNAYVVVVNVRSAGRVTRLDVRPAIWCALAAAAGCLLLLVALAG